MKPSPKYDHPTKSATFSICHNLCKLWRKPSDLNYVGPTSSTLIQQCTNVKQMFCVYWVATTMASLTEYRGILINNPCQINLFKFSLTWKLYLATATQNFQWLKITYICLISAQIFAHLDVQTHISFPITDNTDSTSTSTDLQILSSRVYTLRHCNACGCEYGRHEMSVQCCSNAGPTSSMAASVWHLVAVYPVYVYSPWW